MSEQVMDMVRVIPLGGGYTWDPKVPTSGCPVDVTYKGEVILKADDSTYCCGITWFIWWECFGRFLDIPVTEMKKTQRHWYCATGLRGGCQDALIAINQGTKQTLETAQPGDFLQLWRLTGSGHSVVYTGHNEKEISYWSTQPKTKGIGYRSEPLTAMKELFFVRPLETVKP